MNGACWNFIIVSFLSTKSFFRNRHVFLVFGLRWQTRSLFDGRERIASSWRPGWYEHLPGFVVTVLIDLPIPIWSPVLVETSSV
jgi:hypothetical protein